MEKLNFEQILTVLSDKIGSVKAFAYMDYSEKALGLGKITEVDHYGGEGQGDTWYSVQHFIDHNVYIRVDGYYSSYDGTDFEGWNDSCKEVFPKVRKIIVWE